jgi:hypothetical protein
MKIDGTEDSETNHTATAIWFLIKTPKTNTGENQPLQQMVLGKLVIYLHKTKLDPLSLTLYKKQLQMDETC